MRVSSTTDAPLDTDADTIVVPLVEGEGVPHDLSDGALGALLDGGEARAAPKHLAVTHAEGRRWILAGLGKRDDLDAERARTVAAIVHGRAKELGTRTLCWEAPHKVGEDVVAALVEGTVLAAYRFDRFQRRDEDEDPPRELEALVVSAHHDVAAAVERGAAIAEAANAARDLQNRPANDLTPGALGEWARSLEGVEVEVHDRAFLRERGMGAFLAVAQGTDVPPALIVARYDGGGEGPLIGLVGKAVTHDTGGLSIKPAASMHEMKFDMSGGAAVLGAVRAIARLRLPLRLVAVVGATENAINGSAIKPGDIVTSMAGLTIEVNNTDAEGRLVLCDCVAYARELGAERLVDIATLTGGIVTALGSTYAGLFSQDDAWAAEVLAAGERSGELLWRMPLHREYADQIKGRYADLVNSEGRKAHPIQGAEFLHRFAGDVPWAHIDMAGMSNDLGKPWAAKGGSGWGVRLLVELARGVAGAR